MDLPDEFFSRIGVLLSLTTETFLSLVPLQMSDSKAPLPFASSRLSLGGVVLAWLKVGGGGGGPGAGGAGGGAGILTFNTASQSQHTFTRPSRMKMQVSLYPLIASIGNVGVAEREILRFLNESAF